MELSISGQGLNLLCFGILGLALGLVYDLLRPLRYSGRGGLLWDILFCSAAGAGCFVLSMSAGRLGIWDIASALLGFVGYINFLSPILLPPLLKLADIFFRLLSFFVAKLRLFIQFSKKFFTNQEN